MKHLVCRERNTLEPIHKDIKPEPDHVDKVPGVITVRILTPDPDLSTPLPSESSSQRVLEPYLVIDTTTLNVAQHAGEWMVKRLDPSKVKHDSFRLLWDVRSSEVCQSFD